MTDWAPELLFHCCKYFKVSVKTAQFGNFRAIAPPPACLHIEQHLTREFHYLFNGMASVLFAKKKQTNEENINPWLWFLACLGSAHCSQITTLTKLPKFTNAQTIIFSQLDFYRMKCFFFSFSLTPTNRQTKNRHSIKNNTTATSTATTRFSGDLANSANLAQDN